MTTTQGQHTMTLQSYFKGTLKIVLYVTDGSSPDLFLNSPDIFFNSLKNFMLFYKSLIVTVSYIFKL